MTDVYQRQPLYGPSIRPLYTAPLYGPSMLGPSMLGPSAQTHRMARVGIGLITPMVSHVWASVR